MTSAAAAATTLVIYAYSSFVSSWGVGPTLVKKFKATCQCEVKLVDAGNGGEMISRLKLEKSHLDADVIVGIDENFLPRLKDELGWKQNFTAFEKGPFAFVYNSTIVKNPPASLDDLLKPEWKGSIALEDPRLSTVGLGFLLWVLKEKGTTEGFEYLRKFKTQIKTISPSWDLAYGLFKKKQAKLVFSYWSSPAYHIQEEKNLDFKAAAFSGGHYAQTEYMTIVPTTKNKILAEKFLEFMRLPPAQEEIPRLNFMYPVTTGTKLTPAFLKLGTVKVLPSFSEKEVKENLGEWLKKWREIF